MHPLLGLGGVLSFQDESLVRSEDLKGLGDVPAALDVDTADAANVDREDAFLLRLVLVSKASTGEGEVATFPLLEDFPLAAFLLLELTLNDGFLLCNEGGRTLRVVAEEASPLVLGRVVLKHVEKPGGKYSEFDSCLICSVSTFLP